MSMQIKFNSINKGALWVNAVSQSEILIILNKKKNENDMVETIMMYIVAVKYNLPRSLSIFLTFLCSKTMLYVKTSNANVAVIKINVNEITTMSIKFLLKIVKNFVKMLGYIKFTSITNIIIPYTKLRKDLFWKFGKRYPYFIILELNMISPKP